MRSSKPIPAGNGKQGHKAWELDDLDGPSSAPWWSHLGEIRSLAERDQRGGVESEPEKVQFLPFYKTSWALFFYFAWSFLDDLIAEDFTNLKMPDGNVEPLISPKLAVAMESPLLWNGQVASFIFVISFHWRYGEYYVACTCCLWGPWLVSKFGLAYKRP